MEVLLMAILALMVYVAIKVGKSSNVLIRIAGYSDRRLKGKFIQTEIYISEIRSASPLCIRREVNSSGLTETLIIDALAEFDSLGGHKFLIGEKFEIRCCESFNDGDRENVLASLINRQDFALQGHLNCSEKSFSFIINQLSAGKPLLFRIYGRLVGSVPNGVQVDSDSYEILDDHQISGTEYFCEQYEAYWVKLGEAEKEKMKYFDEKFRLRRLMPTGSGN
jgi:hypothetical protein